MGMKFQLPRVGMEHRGQADVMTELLVIFDKGFEGANGALTQQRKEFLLMIESQRPKLIGQSTKSRCFRRR